MKKLLLALSVAALFLPAIPDAEARTDVSIDFFYNNLGNDGSWTQIGDYGYGWQPSVAVTNRSWRPYADGYWAYTDVGWTWVSYEDFGWATYHYGRWTRVRDRGWFWIPGREWGPAWVSWRTGGEYVGWAPLPPRRGGEAIYEGRPVYGQVDIDYDIGPDYYNFVDVRYIGEPVLRDRICDVNQNYGYIDRTVNVTNITYNNSQVYNYGPDYNTLSAYSTRPIQRLTVQRDSSADLQAAVQSGSLTKVQGDKLFVAAPLTLQKAPAAIAPKTVKEKIVQPTIDHGWANAKDPKAETQLRQKMKSENPKNIPPTTIAPRAGATATTSPANASGGTAADAETNAAPVAPTSPASQPVPQIGKGKNKRGENAVGQPAPSPAETAGTGTPATFNSPRVGGESANKGNGKGKDKRAEKAPPFVAPVPSAPASEPNPEVNPSSSIEQKSVKAKGKRAEIAPRPAVPAVERTPIESESIPRIAPEERPRVKAEKGNRQRVIEPTIEPRAVTPEAPVSEPRAKREKARPVPAAMDEARPVPAIEREPRGGRAERVPQELIQQERVPQADLQPRGARVERAPEVRGPAPVREPQPAEDPRAGKGDKKKKGELEVPPPPNQ